jgi:Uma2 family endonuclease
MVMQAQEIPTAATIVYPESDGQPMADNTKQFEWIVFLKKNLDVLFAADPNVFVAGDLLWYPVQGMPQRRIAPDVMVVFGRPKGDSPEATLCERGSYQQWEEGNIAPQVVFEILSPGNRAGEMSRKLLFYDRHGVEEYYIYDPDRHEFEVLMRGAEGLDVVEVETEWTSPRLQVRFDWSGEELQVFDPSGQPFLRHTEIAVQLAQEKARSEALAAKLRELGIDPEAI